MYFIVLKSTHIVLLPCNLNLAQLTPDASLIPLRLNDVVLQNNHSHEELKYPFSITLLVWLSQTL